MFHCHFCNTSIQPQLDIFRARDNNYCSRECRLKYFNRHIETHNNIHGNNDNNIQGNNHNNYPVKNRVKSIKSHSSCHNLEFLSSTETDSYIVISSSKKSLCDNYLSTTIASILYTVNSLWNNEYCLWNNE